jgi:hypothetical protein
MNMLSSVKSGRLEQIFDFVMLGVILNAMPKRSPTKQNPAVHERTWVSSAPHDTPGSGSFIVINLYSR